MEVIDAEVVIKDSKEFTVPMVVETSRYNEVTDSYDFPELTEWAESLRDMLTSEKYIPANYFKEDAVPVKLNTAEEFAEAKRLRAKISKSMNGFNSARTLEKAKANKIHNDFLAESKNTVNKEWEKGLAQLGSSITAYETEITNTIRKNIQKVWEHDLENNINKDMWNKLGSTETILHDILEITGRVGINAVEEKLIATMNERRDEIDKTLTFIREGEDADRVFTVFSNNGHDLVSALGEVRKQNEQIEALAKAKAEEMLRASQEVVKEEPIPEVPNVENVAPQAPTAPTATVTNASPDTFNADPVIRARIEFFGSKVAINQLLKDAQDAGLQVLGTEIVKQGLFD